MIDKEKIEEAAKEYAFKRPPIINCGARMGFPAGIDWFKENLWHDAKEEPLDDELVMIQYIKEHKVKYMLCHNYSMVKSFWAENAIDSHITKWCYIKDLI